MPNGHNSVLGDADSVVLIFDSHFVVDEIFLQESGQAVRDDFGALVGPEDVGEISDFRDESTKGIEV